MTDRLYIYAIILLMIIYTEILVTKYKMQYYYYIKLYLKTEPYFYKRIVFVY